MMASLLEVGTAGELADGTMKEVTVNGQEVLLARVGNIYYAAAGRCPHMGGHLSPGKLEGTVVTCPLHGSQFDLTDGRVVRWLKGSGLLSKAGRVLKSPAPLTIYRVEVKDGKVMVEI
jgi:3-phenylpropionate/trans-cinnamate dioxygenase ferredoxin subunit